MPEYPQILNLDAIQVLHEEDASNPQYFIIEELPNFLTYGKHHFKISINNPDTEFILKDSSTVIFEFKDANGTVIFSDITSYNEIDGVVMCYVWVKENPLSTHNQIVNGLGTLSVVGELENVPNKWVGNYNVRLTAPIEVRKSLPNTSEIVFKDVPAIQLSASFSESIDLDTDNDNYKRSYVHVSASHLETYGGKVEFIELSYNEGRAINNEYTVITTYPLSSSVYEVSASTQSGLNPISDNQAIPMPQLLRRTGDVVFKLRFLNKLNEYAQDYTKLNDIDVQITSSNVAFAGAPLVIEKEDNLLTGSLFVGHNTSAGGKRIEIKYENDKNVLSFTQDNKSTDLIEMNQFGNNSFIILSGSVASTTYYKTVTGVNKSILYPDKFSMFLDGGKYIGELDIGLNTDGQYGWHMQSYLPVANNPTGIWISTDNSIGINTKIPQARLHVNGTISASNLDIAGSASYSSLSITNDLDVGGTVTAQEFHTEFVSSSIIFSSGSTKFGDTSDDIHQFSGSLRVTGSGDHWISNGNVGIGTTTPTYALDVAGDIGLDQYLYHNGDTDTYLRYLADEMQFRAGAVNFLKLDETTQNIIHFNWDNADVDFQVDTAGGDGALFVQGSDGNVGIGTTSPDSVLDVKSSGDEQLFTLKNSAGNNILRVWNDDDDGATWRLLDSDGAIVNQISSEKSGTTYTYLNSGNVGIGTTLPSGLLHISGGTGDSELILDSSANPNLDFYADGILSSRILSTNGSSNLKFYTSGATEAVIINSSQQVGIGVEPSAPLHVYNASDFPVRIESSDGYCGLEIKDNSDSLYVATNGSTANVGFANTISATNLTILSSGNVGIGTTTPSYKLEVDGTGDFGDTLSFGNGSEGKLSWTGNMGNGQRALTFRGETDRALSFGSDDVLHRVVLDVNGYVGIGTVSPSSSLHVRSDIRSNWLNSETDYFRVSAGSIQGLAIWENAGTGEVFIGNEYNNDAGDIHFSTKVSQDDDNIKMTVQGNGNVGIGTATPAELLDIEGTSGVIQLTGTGGTFDSYINFGTTGDLNSGQIYHRHDDFMKFRVGDDTRMTVSASGYVGIGTATPAYELDVSGTIQASDDLRATDDVYAGDDIWVNNGGGASETNTISFTGQRAIFGYDGSSNAYMQGSSGKRIALQTDGANTRLFIESDGDIGINTTSPQAKLHVNGTISASNLDIAGSASYDSISITNDLTVNGNSYLGNASTDITSISGSLRVSGSGDHWIVGGGNVGIGTVSPAFNLDITGTIRATSTIFGNQFKAGVGTVAGNSYSYSGNGNIGMYFPSAVNIGFSTSGTERMRIDSSGLVGIGTDNPARLLHLDSAGQTDLHITSNGQGSGSTDGMTVFVDASGTGGLWLRESQALRFATAGTERVRIDSSGNVGIGTTSPSDDLHISSSNPIIRLSNSTTGGVQSFIQNVYTGGNNFMRFYAGAYAMGIHSNSSVAIGGSYTPLQPSSSNSLVVQSRVGIGTSSPTGSLHVVGSSTSGIFAGLFVENGVTYEESTTGTSANKRMVSVQGDGGAYFMGRDVTNNIEFVMGTSTLGEAFAGAMTAHDMSLRTDNSDRLTVKATTGYVGIGTTTPSALFELSSGAGGHSSFSTSVGGVTTQISSSASSTNLILDKGISGADAKIQFKTAGSLNFEIGVDSTPADIFKIGRTNNNADFVVDTSGNVGIGTTTPSASLEVNGGIRFGTDSFASNIGQLYTDSTLGTVLTGVVGGTYELALAESGGNILLASPQGTSHVSLVPTSGGNVGIGTTTPVETLTVAGNISQSYSSTGSFGMGYFNGNVGVGTTNPTGMFELSSTQPNVQFMETDGSADENWRLSTSGGKFYFSTLNDVGTTLANRVIIQQDGNVGIGTTTPSASLHVAGDILLDNNQSIKGVNSLGTVFDMMKFDNQNDLYIGGSGYNQRYIGLANRSQIVLNTQSGDYMEFNVNGEIVRMTSAGDVGINTTTPQTKLHVNGNISASSIEIASSASFSGDILPSADDTYNLGSTTYRWKDVHSVQTTTGGVFEVGLRTKEIGTNPTGTVVIWRDNKLQPCDKEYDNRVMGIVKHGKDEPMIQGAEKILITGKISEGDYIVSSDKIGCGMKAGKRFGLFNRNLHGKIIGQALEDGNGDKYLLKAMIWKM